jgi:hypothetical protein
VAQPILAVRFHFQAGQRSFSRSAARYLFFEKEIVPAAGERRTARIGCATETLSLHPACFSAEESREVGCGDSGRYSGDVGGVGAVFGVFFGYGADEHAGFFGFFAGFERGQKVDALAGG